MTHAPSDTALLDAALAAIHEVMVRLDGRSGTALPDATPEPIEQRGIPSIAISTATATATSATPEQIAERLAVQRYLLSAGALLEASLTLIRQPVPLCPRDRLQRRMRLVEQAKTAGRAAYGAALALTDPGAVPRV